MRTPPARRDEPTADRFLEVAVWSKPCGRYRALSCGGRRSRAQALRHLAASAPSRRTIRYSSVEKRAVFGPKMVAGDNLSRGVQPHGKAGLKGERGLRAPWRRLRPSQCHGGFQSRRGKASSTTTSGVCSAIGRRPTAPEPPSALTGRRSAQGLGLYRPRSGSSL